MCPRGETGKVSKLNVKMWEPDVSSPQALSLEISALLGVFENWPKTLPQGVLCMPKPEFPNLPPSAVPLATQ